MKHTGTIIALVTFILFVWFCHYSYEHKRDVNQGYDHSEFDVLKPLKQKQAEAYKALYEITDDDAGKEVVLW